LLVVCSVFKEQIFRRFVTATFNNISQSTSVCQQVILKFMSLSNNPFLATKNTLTRLLPGSQHIFYLSINPHAVITVTVYIL
ncbi:hypothetical protein, partial [Oceanobacillus salinisoli]|uniref:hypothetical protein n=1 Tax=Oceanobacillus salinisoli TaxID=2678611 RepID=UPI001E401C98